MLEWVSYFWVSWLNGWLAVLAGWLAGKKRFSLLSWIFVCIMSEKSLDMFWQNRLIFIRFCQEISWEFIDRITASPRPVVNSLPLFQINVVFQCQQWFYSEFPRQNPNRIIVSAVPAQITVIRLGSLKGRDFPGQQWFYLKDSRNISNIINTFWSDSISTFPGLFQIE